MGTGSFDMISSLRYNKDLRSRRKRKNSNIKAPKGKVDSNPKMSKAELAKFSEHFQQKQKRRMKIGIGISAFVVALVFWACYTLLFV